MPASPSSADWLSFQLMTVTDMLFVQQALTIIARRSADDRKPLDVNIGVDLHVYQLVPGQRVKAPKATKTETPKA